MGGATAGALSAALILRLGPRLSQDDQGRSGRVRAGPSGPARFFVTGMVSPAFRSRAGFAAAQGPAVEVSAATGVFAWRFINNR